jgi:hypothetical protein
VLGFFSHVVTIARRRKLKTVGSGFFNFIDKSLESRKARSIAAISALIGLIASLIQLVGQT